MHLGEHQALGGAAQRGIRAFRIFRQYEELGAIERREQNIVHLRGGSPPVSRSTYPRRLVRNCRNPIFSTDDGETSKDPLS